MAIADGVILTAADIWPVAGKMTLATAGPAISTASTWVQITFDTLTYDTSNLGAGGMMDKTTGIITIPAAGKYRIVLVFPWSNYASAYDRIVAVARGTSAPSSGNSLAAARCTQTARWWVNVVAEDTFAAGDQITAWIYSTVTSSGGNPTEAGAPLTSLSVQKIV